MSDPFAGRALGRSGVTVQQLGFGSSPLGQLPSEELARETLDALQAEGFRYFDAAPFYGNGQAERRLGTAIRRVERKDLVLSSKVGRLLTPLKPGEPRPAPGLPPFAWHFDFTYDGVMRSFEDSLQRLGTDYIDIVLVHDLNAKWQGDALESSFATLMSGGYRALLALREQGALRAFGVGVSDWRICMRFADAGDFDCFMLAHRYTLLEHEALEVFLPMCAQRGIGVLLAGPYNSGILATGAVPGAQFLYAPAGAEVLARVRRIEAVCARHGVPLPAAALRFPLGHAAVASVVTGMVGAAEVAASIAYFRHPIPPDFWLELKAERLIPTDAPVPAN